MNWDDYRYFLAVARSGRLTQAAQQLGVDHATVGRRVKSLEKYLKVNLFDRSPQGYRLTDSGHKLLEFAEVMETKSIQANDAVGASEQELSGVVRVGAPEGVATSVLSEIAIKLCEEHPRLELQIVAISQSFSLSKREADVAITVSAPTAGRLKFRKISDYTLHLYGTKDYLTSKPAVNNISDLKRLRGIAYVPELIYDKELDYIPLLGPEIKPHLTSNSVHVQLEATLRNGGVCILHDFVAEKYPQLVRVLSDEISFKRAFYFVVHEDYAELERIRVVSETVVEAMRKRLS